MMTYKKKQLAMNRNDNSGRRVGFPACSHIEMLLQHFPMLGPLLIRLPFCFPFRRIRLDGYDE